MARISQTIAQVAAKRANQLIAPQLAAQNTYGQAQNQAIRSFAQSLLGKLQPIAGQVGADYGRAIQQTGSLSNQAATFLQNANPTPQVQQLLQSAGAPAEQQQQIASRLGQTFGGGAGVLSFLTGAVPGGELAAQGAAAQAQAAQLPAIAALKGQQDLSSALFQQQQDRAKIEATRPGLVQAAEKDIRANQLAQAKLALSEKAAQATAAYRKAQITQHALDRKQTAADKAAARADAKAYHDSYLSHLEAGDNERAAHDAALEAAANARNAETAAHNAQTERTAAYNADTSRINARTSQTNAETAQTRARTSDYRARHPRPTIIGSDKTGRYAYNPSTGQKTLVVAPVKARAGGAGGITASTYAGLKGEAQKAADLFYYGQPPDPNKVSLLMQRERISQADAEARIGGIPGISYSDALKRLINGFSLRRADAVAILNEFYAPGERGRPVLQTAAQKRAGATAAARGGAAIGDALSGLTGFLSG